jgi:hypothetical protein
MITHYGKNARCLNEFSFNGRVLLLYLLLLIVYGVRIRTNMFYMFNMEPEADDDIPRIRGRKVRSEQPARSNKKE